MVSPVNQPQLTLNVQINPSPELMEVLRLLLTRATLTPGFSSHLEQTATSVFPDFSQFLTPAPAANVDLARSPSAVGGSVSEVTLPESPLLQELFETRVLPILRIEDKSSTIAGYKTSIKHFVRWWCKMNPRSTGPRVHDLEQSPSVVGEYYGFLLSEGAEKTAANKLKNLRSVWRLLHSEGLIGRSAPEPRTRQIRKQAQIERSKHIPIPASDDEITRLLEAILAVSRQLKWPILGRLEPWQFWWNVIAACCVHGFRPADMWPLEKTAGRGLLWSEVCFEPSPPIDGGETARLQADWEFGWLKFRINKTGGNLLAPISPHLFWLIQQCRGLSADRVFPLPYARKGWYDSVNLIKSKANLDRDVSLCGQAPSASLRKTSAVIWKRHAGRAAASFMLGHSVRSGTSDDVFSDVTEQHYMGADVLREVVQGFPAVLSALPSLIRC